MMRRFLSFSLFCSRAAARDCRSLLCALCWCHRCSPFRHSGRARCFAGSFCSNLCPHSADSSTSKPGPAMFPRCWNTIFSHQNMDVSRRPLPQYCWRNILSSIPKKASEMMKSFRVRFHVWHQIADFFFAQREGGIRSIGRNTFLFLSWNLNQ